MQGDGFAAPWRIAEFEIDISFTIVRKLRWRMHHCVISPGEVAQCGFGAPVRAAVKYCCVIQEWMIDD